MRAVHITVYSFCLLLTLPPQLSTLFPYTTLFRSLEILNQLGFGFRRIVATLFAVFGRFLALKFVEEGELGAGDVLHLFPEAADAVELADCGDVGILVFRHGFSESDKIPFCKLERAADAF